MPSAAPMQWASFLGCPPSWAQILLMPDHHLQVGHLQLRALANAQLAHFGTQISIDGEPLLVGNNFAQSFALIVHELAVSTDSFVSSLR